VDVPYAPHVGRSRRRRRDLQCGKSKAQIFDKDTNVKLNFSDVAGLEEAKTEVMEIVDFLRILKNIHSLVARYQKGRC